MPLTNRQKQQAREIRDLLLAQGWKAYEEFIKDYIYEYLGSSLNKDTLIGLKMAIDEAKKLVLAYENE